MGITLKAWLEKMGSTYSALTTVEKHELHQWVDDFVASSGKYDPSAWPGWEKYMGKKPVSP